MKVLGADLIRVGIVSYERVIRQEAVGTANGMGCSGSAWARKQPQMRSVILIVPASGSSWTRLS